MNISRITNSAVDMNRPRVCFVFPSIYRYLEGEIAGGAHRQLTLLGKELQGEFEVHFIAGDYGQPQTQTKDGFVLHRSYTPSPTTPKYIEPFQLASLYHAMQRSDADIFVHRGGVKPAVISFILASLLDTPWIYNVAMDTDLTDTCRESGLMMRSLFRYAIRNATTVIAQTGKQASIIGDDFDSASRLVPNGYPAVTDELAHDERDYFLWVGRLRKNQKQPHIYLDLAKEFPESEFLLAGPMEHDEEYAESIKAEAAKLSNVNFLGFVDPGEIHKYYRRAKAVINTSAYEGFPSTFLEAWRYDTPVISLSVDPGRFAELPESPGFARDNFQELVRIVGTIEDNPEERQRIAQPYKSYFIENYTIAETSKRYADVLSELV